MILLLSSQLINLQQPSASWFFTSFKKSSQACNLLEQFNLGSTQILKTLVYNISFSVAVESVFNVKQNDELITSNEKIYQLATLYTNWAHKNKKKFVEKEELVSC